MTSIRKIVIVTGLSGSGKSTALKALEDLGFFTIDNPPAPMITQFIESLGSSHPPIQQLAIGLDSRDRAFVEHHEDVFASIRVLNGAALDILFVEARVAILIRRFSETRRKHPIATNGDLEGAIRIERKQLQALRDRADLVIDTSEMNVHDLKRLVMERYSGDVEERRFQLSVLSFGFRYGIPQEADMVLDVRFLPNPHFIDELRDKTGNDREVCDFVFKQKITGDFFRRTVAYLRHLLPLYENEGKAYFHLAIGCTGGKHRSVSIANAIHQELQKSMPCSVVHKDIDKRH